MRYVSRKKFEKAATELIARFARSGQFFAVTYWSKTDGDGFVTRQCGARYLSRERVQNAHASGEVIRTPALDKVPEGCVRVTLRASGGAVPECRNVRLSRILRVVAGGKSIECDIPREEME